MTRPPGKSEHGDDRRVEQFIERMGMLTEQDGLPRIAGRIFGLLLLTPGDLSLDDIAERLGVSKASVSNDARRLTMHGLLERRTRPGDRRDYYAIAPDAFLNSVQARLQQMRRFNDLLDSARDLAASSPEVDQRWTQLAFANDLAVRVLEEVLRDARAARFPPRDGSKRSGTAKRRARR